LKHISFAFREFEQILTWLPLRHFRFIHRVRNLQRQKRLFDCNQGVAIGRQEVANRATGSTYRQEEGNRKRGSGRDRKYIQIDLEEVCTDSLFFRQL